MPPRIRPLHNVAPPPPASPLTTETTLALDRETISRLRIFAAARETTVSRLCERLIDVIATENLCDAVLDDH
jgi:hypothetical protein